MNENSAKSTKMRALVRWRSSDSWLENRGSRSPASRDTEFDISVFLGQALIESKFRVAGGILGITFGDIVIIPAAILGLFIGLFVDNLYVQCPGCETYKDTNQF